MSKVILTAALLLTTLIEPALAQSSSSQENGSVLLTQPTVNASSDAAQKSSKLGKIFQTPVACCGALAGVTLGVPVRVARDVSHETVRMSNQLHQDFSGSADDRPDIYARSMGTMVGMIYGVPSGIILGTIHGTTRGIDAGYKKPFSRESVSLTDPK